MSQYNELRYLIWAQYAGSVLAMTYHPGTTRDNAVRLSVEEVANIADQMLLETDKRFNKDKHGSD